MGDNWGLTLGEAQYQWLKRTLETSDARFKFVFCHNLVGGLDQNMRGGIEAADKYEWGGKNADGSWGFAAHRPGWPLPIHQLMVENNVTIFFHGHDHLFVKQDLDGIVYQEVPQPSYASYDKTDSAAEYGYTHGDVLGCCGYLPRRRLARGGEGGVRAVVPARTTRTPSGGAGRCRIRTRSRRGEGMEYEARRTRRPAPRRGGLRALRASCFS